MSETAKLAYIERVRDAMQLLAEELTPEEYIEALSEISTDLDGMLDAARHEVWEARGKQPSRSTRKSTRAKGST